MSNISPKQKVVIVLTAVVCLTGAFVFYKTGVFSSESKQEIQGSAKVKSSPKDDQIKKHLPGDEVIISADSPLNDIYEQDKENKLKKAETSDTTYLDTFDFNKDKGDKINNGQGNADAFTNRDTVQDDFFSDFNAGNNKVDPNAPKKETYQEMIARQLAEQEEALRKKKERELEEQRLREEARLRHERELAALEYAEKERARMADFLSREVNQVQKDNYKRDDYEKSVIEATAPGGIAVLGFSTSKEAKANQSNTQSGSQAPAWRSRLEADIQETKSRLVATQNQMAADEVGQTSTGRTATRDPYSPAEQNASNYPGYPSYAASQAQKQGVSHRINAGNRYFATLDFAVNTDVTQHVTVTIHEEGPLKQAKLLGTVEQLNSSAKIELTNLSIDGRDYAIKAIVLDHNAKYGELADKVDTHFFERWGALTLASLVEGYSNGVQGYTSERTGDTTVERRDKVVDDKEQIAVAIGNVGRRAAPIIEENFEREPTVYVEINKPVTVFFLQSFEVLE